MKIEFIFTHNGITKTLPVNPENLEWVTSGANETMNVVGLGEIVVPKKSKLPTTNISAYFPANENDTPQSYIEFFEKARASLKPMNFTVTGLKQARLVVIENFTYDRRAGEHNDIYYSMDLREYRPYGAEYIGKREFRAIRTATELTIPPVVVAQPSVPQRSNENKPETPSTHVTGEGDTLGGIGEKFGVPPEELFKDNAEAIADGVEDNSVALKAGLTLNLGAGLTGARSKTKSTGTGIMPGLKAGLLGAGKTPPSFMQMATDKELLKKARDGKFKNIDTEL